MDSSQFLMASGGMLSILVGLLTLLMPIILLLIAWRIVKWTSSTARQVEQLNQRMDQLLQHFRGEAATGVAGQDASTGAADDDFDILATAPAAAGLSASSAAETIPVASGEPATEESEAEEEGFEFPADEDDAFAGFDTDEPAPEPTAASESGPAEDAFGAEEDLDFDLDEPAGETFAGTGEEAEEQDAFADEIETDDPMTGALGSDSDEQWTEPAAAAEPAGDEDAFDAKEEFDFDLDEPAEESFAGIAEEAEGAAEVSAAAGDVSEDSPSGAFGLEEETDAAQEAAEEDEEDRRMEESFDSAFPSGDAEPAAAPAAEEPAEEELPEPEEPAPAIIPLEDDPERPEVSLARCGSCDHKLAYKKTLAGKKARCPSCKEPFILP